MNSLALHHLIYVGIISQNTKHSSTIGAHLLLEFDVPEDVVHPECLGQNWTKEEGEPNGGYPNSNLRETEREIYSVTDCPYTI